jgi:hypothetical protein
MPRRKYDIEYLNVFVLENKISLTKDYSKDNVTSSTVIYAKCINCDKSMVEKSFYKLVTNKTFGCTSCLKDISRERYKKTCIERFGCENPFQNYDIKEKMKKTNIQRFGCEYPTQNTEVREKSKKTNMERFGCEYSSQNAEVREKVKKTNLEKFGCENPTQNTEVREKCKKTYLINYGVEHPSQIPHVKEQKFNISMTKTREIDDEAVIEKVEEALYKISDAAIESMEDGTVFVNVFAEGKY